MAITIEIKYDIGDEVYFLLNHKITKGKISTIRFDRRINYYHDEEISDSQKIYDETLYMLLVEEKDGITHFETQNEKTVFLSR